MRPDCNAVFAADGKSCVCNLAEGHRGRHALQLGWGRTLHVEHRETAVAFIWRLLFGEGWSGDA